MKRQSLVLGFTPPLRTMVRPVRVNAPQVSNASLAETVVTLQSNRVPGKLGAERAPRWSIQRCSHFVLPCLLSISATTCSRGGVRYLNLAFPLWQGVKGTVCRMQMHADVISALKFDLNLISTFLLYLNTEALNTTCLIHQVINLLRWPALHPVLHHPI